MITEIQIRTADLSGIILGLPLRDRRRVEEQIERFWSSASCIHYDSVLVESRWESAEDADRLRVDFMASLLVDRDRLETTAEADARLREALRREPDPLRAFRLAIDAWRFAPKPTLRVLRRRDGVQ